VQYKKVASLMIISLAIEHTDLMSNVEQGMSNYEVLFFFGNTYIKMAEFLPSTFMIPCSTFDIQKSYPFNVLSLFCIAPLLPSAFNLSTCFLWNAF